MAMNTYEQPGVTVVEGAGYASSVTTPNDVVTALVGMASGSISGNETVELSSTPVALATANIDAETIVVSSRLNGAAFAADVDYVVSSGESVTIERVLTAVTDVVSDVSGETHSLTAGVATQLSHRNIVGDVTVLDGETPVSVIVDKAQGTITSETSVVGASVSYSYTAAAAVEISTSPTIVEPSSHIESGSVVVVDDPSLEAPVVYTEGSDYAINYSLGTITLISGGLLSLGDLVYVSYDKCAIESGESVRVTFSFTPANYYEPIVHTNYQSVIDMYGAPFSADGTINSEISLAAYHAFGNGSGVVVCVATPSASVSDIAAGIDKLGTIDDVDLVLPLSGSSAVHDYAVSTSSSSSFTGHERTALLGFDGVASLVSANDMIAVAQGYNSERAVVVAPSAIRMREFGSGFGSEVTIAGYFLAAAIAGAISRNGRYTPITMKSISGFSSLVSTETRADINNEMKGGLCVVALKSGSLRVLHGRTTTADSIEKREISVSMSHDFIIRSVRNMLSVGFIGSAITATTTSSISTSVSATLSSLSATGYLLSYSGITASIPDGEPTTVEVRFSYKPTYALNYINVTISIDTTTV